MCKPMASPRSMQGGDRQAVLPRAGEAPLLAHSEKEGSTWGCCLSARLPLPGVLVFWKVFHIVDHNVVKMLCGLSTREALA